MWHIYFNFEDHSMDGPTLKFSKIGLFSCNIL
ncbi:DUF3986 family protein [Bacillus swezeyi]